METLDNHQLDHIKLFWDSSKSFIFVIVACLLLLFVKPHLLSFLDKIVAWIQPCSRGMCAFLISLGAVALSAFRIYKISRHEQQVAHHTFALELFLLLVYTYFRFIDTTYEFWGPVGCSYRWCDILYLPFALLLVQIFACSKTSSKNDGNSIHLVDKPIQEPNDDIFNYDSMSEGLLSDLSSVDVSEQSYSVGILGEWGQGKSSFMNLFKLHAENGGAVVVKYYPRSSKSINSIQEDFFNALKERLSHFHTGIGRYITSYSRSVADVDEGWIGRIALAFNLLTRDKEKERINKVIKSISRRIYVLIEDLDRLTGEEILEVFKLIERNGDFCNTVFLTAYDKAYVNEVIGHYLGHKRYQDYTDKYFDYEYSLPINNRDTLNSFANGYFSSHAELVSKNRTNQADILSAWNDSGDFVVNHLGTLRHVKRFINLFMSRYTRVKNDVVVSDFLLLSLLRYKDLTSYNSIISMHFLKRGTLYVSGSPKLIYLQDNYLDTIKALNIPDSSREIIESLFKKKEDLDHATIEDEYGRLKWSDSFNSYFFDYRIGKYHNEDFQQLFEGDLDDAFSLMKKIHEDGFAIQLEDFLRSRKVSWISDEKGLERLLSLLIYLDSLNRTIDLEGHLDRMTIKDTYVDFEKAGVVKSEKSYHDVVLNVYKVMMGKYPMEIGFSCQRITQALFSGKISDNDLVISANELKNCSIWAQRHYYQRYPNGDYLFNAIINMAIVREEKNGEIQISIDAKRGLASLMKLYPKQFAKDLLDPLVSNTQQKPDVLGLRMNELFDESLFLPVDDFSFEAWVLDYLDEKTAYVMRKVYDCGKNSVLRVHALKPVYEKGDFQGYFDAIKKQEEIDDDNVVRDVIANHLSLDLYTIGESTGIGLERAKKSVKRLVQTGVLESHFNAMKERIEPYEIGDYVRIVSKKFESYAASLYYTDNIFKVIEMNGEETVKLSGLKVLVPRNDIEAIPIDGIHDRGLYYDPVIAATYVADGEPVPVHHSRNDEYYMDGLENTKLEGGKTLKSVVQENDCHFVHEVQHCLRRAVNSDDLKLNHTIKKDYGPTSL